MCTLCVASLEQIIAHLAPAMSPSDSELLNQLVHMSSEGYMIQEECDYKQIVFQRIAARLCYRSSLETVHALHADLVATVRMLLPLGAKARLLVCSLFKKGILSKG